MPCVLWPSMATIRSPGCMPALSAGVPSIGAITFGTPFCDEIWMPRPPNLPEMSAWVSWNSCSFM